MDSSAKPPDGTSPTLFTRAVPDDPVEQALALLRASAKAPNSRQCQAHAEQIGELLSRYDTPEIAQALATALFNVTCTERNRRKRAEVAC